MNIDELRATADQNPHDANVWYALACEYDRNGLEADAAPVYARALDCGVEMLPEHERSGLYVGYGSTLRNIDDVGGSRRILQEGIARFPEVAALKVFLALTEYTAGRFRESSRLMFEALIPTDGDESLTAYRRALKYYADNVDTEPFPPRT
jgi:tetratricopeptide (TPR) repeat protein